MTNCWRRHNALLAADADAAAAGAAAGKMSHKGRNAARGAAGPSSCCLARSSPLLRLPASPENLLNHSPCFSSSAAADAAITACFASLCSPRLLRLVFPESLPQVRKTARCRDAHPPGAQMGNTKHEMREERAQSVYGRPAAGRNTRQCATTVARSQCACTTA